MAAKLGSVCHQHKQRCLQVVRLATVVAMWPLLTRVGYGLNWREGIILV